MKKAYVCIGGPLNGQFATSKDFHQERVSIDYRNSYMSRGGPLPTVFHPAGKFARWHREYCEYNSGRRNGISMVWIHDSLLQKPINVGK